jgi:hypothetical protein
MAPRLRGAILSDPYPIFSPEFLMNRILLVLFLVVLCVVGVGFYRGWFATETDSSGGKSNINFSVDREKIKDDVDSLKKKAANATETK